MSFKSYKLWGLVSNLFMILIPLVVLFISGSLILSASNIPDYLAIVINFSNIVILILFLMSMRGFAKYYDDTTIYQNILYVVVLGVVNIISTRFFTYFIEQFPSILRLALLLVYIGVFGILSGFFYRKAFYALSEKSGEQYFQHAGWLFFIGGILTVIVIGAFVVLLARMFAVLAFNSMKPKSSQTSSVPETPTN